MTHYAELTAIDCPLGELDDDTASRLWLARRQGAPIEYWSTSFKAWRSTMVDPAWTPETKYRLATPSSAPDFIPWGAVHLDFNFHARDSSGLRFFYGRRPDMHKHNWSSLGISCNSAATAGIIIGDKLWDQSLVCRPRSEGK